MFPNGLKTAVIGAQDHGLRPTEDHSKAVLDFSNRSFKEGIKEVGGKEGREEGGRREGRREGEGREEGGTVQQPY